MKSYDVTIQTNPLNLCLYVQMLLFVFKILQNEIWEFLSNADFGQSLKKNFFLTRKPT